MTHSATHINSIAMENTATSKQRQDDLSMQEIGYLMLMWSVLAINVMLITFINNSFTHCL
jgi:hypothetical protein